MNYWKPTTLYAPYELYHYGILGQKWGVRRFQNPDGSLTDAGKKRYNQNVDALYRRLYDYDTMQANKETVNKVSEAFGYNKDQLVDYLDGFNPKDYGALFNNLATKKLKDIDDVVIMSAIRRHASESYAADPHGLLFGTHKDHYAEAMSMRNDYAKEKYGNEPYSYDQMRDIDSRLYTDSHQTLFLKTDSEKKLGRILTSGNNGNVSEDSPYYKLSSDIWQKSYNWYDHEYNGPQQSLWKKFDSQYQNGEISKKEFDDKMAAITLEDLGFEPTETNKRLIWSTIYWD